MQFGNPTYLNWLWALLPLALACALLLRRRRRQVRLMFADEALSRVAPNARLGRRTLRLAIWIAAVASLMFALARPQWGFRWEQVQTKGLDILVLLDASHSMLASDFKPSRLQQAKWGLRDFARGLRGDRIGLIPFAGSAYLLCPLTSDYAAFLMSLEDVEVGIMPRPGTSIASALRLAVETFDKQAVADRALVLITDGEDHEGGLERWVAELKERKVRVYAIGVGGLEGEPLPPASGGPGFHKDRAGNVVLSALREEPLKWLAQETGGAYIRAVPGDIGLDQLISGHLAALSRTEGESRLSKVWEERAGWFIGAGLLLLAVESAFREQGGKSAT